MRMNVLVGAALALTTIGTLLLLSICIQLNPAWLAPARVHAHAGGPRLLGPAGVAATTAHTVTVPVDFERNNTGVAGLAFSIDFDENCLAFNAADANGDGTPDAVRFTLPGVFSGAATYNASDSDGELDIVIADYSPPMSTLPDTGGLVRIEFTAVCTPQPGQSILAAVDFAQDPLPSFSDTEGATIEGSVSGGTVEITGSTATLTPGGTPSPAPTATVTATATPTVPTGLELLSFTASLSQNGVLIRWMTTAEPHTAGFYVDRSVEDVTGAATDFVHLTALIRSQGESGGQYGIFDDAVVPGYTYRYLLVEQDVDGLLHAHLLAEVTIPPLAGSHSLFLPLIQRS